MNPFSLYLVKNVYLQLITFRSVSRLTCRAISVFSLLGSNVRELRSPPPVLIRPLKQNTDDFKLGQDNQSVLMPCTYKRVDKISTMIFFL